MRYPKRQTASQGPRGRPSTPLGSLLLAFWLAAAPGGLTAQSTLQSPVILITVDTWRADYLGVTGSGKAATPVLDALAKDGAWFETAYCQVPLTPPSHASILTGLYPASHGVRDFTSGALRPGIPTLASILKERGYQTGAFVSALVLDSVWGLDRGFDLYSDSFAAGESDGSSPGNVQKRAQETIDEVLEWLKERSSKPYFLWVHLFDPHHDYDPPAPFKTRFATDPYAGEVAYADSQIGRLIAALKERGDYSSSLIVATSDHGESLGEHGEPNHGLLLYETTTRVPLIFKLPDSYEIPTARIGRIAETVDIAPTVLQVLRLPTPAWRGMEGRGRLAAILGKPDNKPFAFAETLYPRTTFGWSALSFYREGRHKFIEAPVPELYDLEADPDEQRNLYPSNSALAGQLRTRLGGFQQRLAGSQGAAPEAGDAELVERLGALGYVAVSAPVPVALDQALEDPKQNLPLYRRIVQALDASEAGRLRESNQILEAVAQERPGLFIVQYSLGLNLLKLNQPREALSFLQKAKQLNPDYLSIDLNLARAQAHLGDVEPAAASLRAVLERNPDHPAARHQLGALYRRSGKAREAASLFRQLAEDRPDDLLAVRMAGVSLIDVRQFEQGLEFIDRAIRMGGEDALGSNYRGIALANLSRSEEAKQAYRTALSLKPDYSQARLNLAFLLLAGGEGDSAREEFQIVCQQDSALCQRYRDRFQPPG